MKSGLQVIGSNQNRVLVGKGDSVEHLTVIGSTLSLAVRPGQQVQQLPIPSGEEGIIALEVHFRNPVYGGEYNRTSLVNIIKVVQKDDVTIVEPDETFVPEGRLGQIVRGEGRFGRAYLQVRDGAEFFTSTVQKGSRYVDDPNLLCHYLYGTVDADELRAVATEAEEEVKARELLPQLRQKITELEEKIKFAEKNMVMA